MKSGRFNKSKSVTVGDLSRPVLRAGNDTKEGPRIGRAFPEPPSGMEARWGVLRMLLQDERWKAEVSALSYDFAMA